jgi:hypothetical protein
MKKLYSKFFPEDKLSVPGLIFSFLFGILAAFLCIRLIFK